MTHASSCIEELDLRWSASSTSPLCFIAFCLFFFSSRRRHTRFDCDWSSDVCSSDLRLPVTLELLVAALSVSLAIAIPMGIVSAVKRNSGVDLVSTVFALVGFAMPGFWLGIILIYVFALLLRWLPPSGWVPLPASVPPNLLSLVLPAFTLGTALAALVTRQLRSGMLEVLRQDYVRTAQAKGLSERLVVGKHALKNAPISVVPVVCLH